MQHKGQSCYAHTERQNGLDTSNLYLSIAQPRSLHGVWLPISCPKYFLFVVVSAMITKSFDLLNSEHRLQRLFHPSTHPPDSNRSWSYIPDVRIANALRGKSLEGTIATVLVWNNSSWCSLPPDLSCDWNWVLCAGGMEGWSSTALQIYISMLILERAKVFSDNSLDLCPDFFPLQRCLSSPDWNQNHPSPSSL